MGDSFWEPHKQDWLRGKEKGQPGEETLQPDTLVDVVARLRLSTGCNKGASVFSSLSGRLWEMKEK